MAISRDEVLHVARLARLALTEEEVDRFAGQLSAILEAVGKVAELDLSEVEPTLHPLDLSNVWAEDEPRPSLPVEEALANAPDREGGFFRVPAALMIDTLRLHAPRRPPACIEARRGSRGRRAPPRLPRRDRRARPRAARVSLHRRASPTATASRSRSRT